MSLPRFLVRPDAVRGGAATVGGQELEHMRRVLRLRPGARVLLWDAAGTEHEAVIRAYDGGAAALTVLRSCHPERESPLAVTLAQAVGKGDKMDRVVEKATELGVNRVVPLVSSRTIPRVGGERRHRGEEGDRGDRGERRRERWQKIAAAAARQSGRTRIPEVLAPEGFEALLARDWRCDARLLFRQGPSARRLASLKDEFGSLRSVLVVVGPEGGFSESEAARAAAHGFHTVGLGPRILRTETAGAAAVCAVQLLWGDLG